MARLGLVILALASLVWADEHPGVGLPFAVVDGPSMTLPGGVESFSAARSFDFDGQIVHTVFRFGDEVVEAASATFRFDEPGVHHVILTVTDDAGRTASVAHPVLVATRADQIKQRLAARERRGAVMLLCERGDPETARSIEEVGNAIFQPAMSLAYGEVAILFGDDARPDRFFEAIREVASRRDAVDIFLYAHGSEDHLWFKARTSATSADILRELKGRGGEKIRAVYTTLCWGETMNRAWREVGARAASGAVHVHIPVEAPSFMLGWLAGREFGSLTGTAFRANWEFHEFRNQTVEQLRPVLTLVQQQLGQDALGRTLSYYIEWFLKDGEWETWKSFPLIDGGGVTIDTFDAPIPDLANPPKIQPR